MTTLQRLDDTFALISEMDLENTENKNAALKATQDEIFTRLSLQKRIPKELIKEVYQLMMGEYIEEELYKTLQQKAGQLVHISHHGFDMKTYSQLLIYTKLAAFYEGTTNPEVDAYKLTLLWGDEQKARKYLEISFKENVNSLRKMQDACLYSVPPDDNWDVEVWRKLFEKNMLRTDFIKSGVFGNASAIQKEMTTPKHIEVKSRKKTPPLFQAEAKLHYDEAALEEIKKLNSNIEELKIIGKEINKQISELNKSIRAAIPESIKKEMSTIESELAKEQAKLKADPSLAESIELKKKKLRELNESIDEIEEIKELKRKLNALNTQAKDVQGKLRNNENKLLAYAREPLLENTDYKVLMRKVLGLTYKNANKNQEAAELFHKYGINENLFENYLALSERAKNSDIMLPPIVITGEEYGCPGYYMIKLKKNNKSEKETESEKVTETKKGTKSERVDPKGAILGYITGCCQSIGSNGDACARHGVTSEMGGFYVLCKGVPPKDGYTNKISPKDIIAQSWAWRAQNDTIVFDSIESQPNMRADPRNVEIMRKMYHALGVELTQKHNINEVKVGVGGYAATPSVVGYTSDASKPLDHQGYQDSSEQRGLATRDFPLYAKFYINFDNAYQEYLHLSEEEKKKYDPKLIENIFLRLAKPEQMTHLFEEMQKKGIDIKQYINDNNMLYICAQYGNAGLISYLIQQGAEIDKPNINDRGNTPLLRAIMNGQSKAVEEFIKNNAEINEEVISTCSFAQRENPNPIISKSLLDAFHKKVSTTINYPKNKDTLFLLEYAIRLNHTELVKELIKNGIDVNETIDGWPILLSALYKGNDELVKFLIKKKANIFFNKESALGGKIGDFNALDFAKYHGSSVLLKMLKSWEHTAYKENALNRQDHKGRTLLMWAVIAKDKDLMKRLLQNGADVSVKDNQGNSVINYLSMSPGLVIDFIEANPHLINAVYQDKTLLINQTIVGENINVKELLKRGADIHYKDLKGRNALHYAAGFGKEDVVKTLIENNVNLFEADNANMTALDWPLKNTNFRPIADLIMDAWAKKLTAPGSNVNQMDKTDKTLLMWAVIYQRDDLIEKLLENGADLNTLRDQSGKTALDYANPPLLQKLLTKIIDSQKTDQPDQNGKTILMRVVQMGDQELLQKLLQRGGVSVNEKDKEGNTALHYVISTRNNNIRDLLLQHGADPFVENVQGLSARVLCTEDLVSLWFTACLNRIDKDPTLIDIPDPSGKTLLIRAVDEGRDDIVDELLKKKADTMIEDINGDTALEYAVRSRNIGVIDLLLAHGADPNHKDQNGSTLLHLAVYSDHMGSHLDLIEHLLDINPKMVNIKNVEGQTALHHAIDRQNSEIIEFLVKHGAKVDKEITDFTMSKATPSTFEFLSDKKEPVHISRKKLFFSKMNKEDQAQEGEMEGKKTKKHKGEMKSKKTKEDNEDEIAKPKF